MIEPRDIVSFYQLVDPRDRLPFYVGLTTSPEERLRAYQISRPHSAALAKRKKELDALGLQPIMQELERRECTADEALEREAYWIHHLNSQGIALLNKNNNKRDWKQKTIYIPPSLEHWLNIQAAQERREISEIVTEALEEYQQRH